VNEPTQEEVISVVSSIFDVSAMGRTLQYLQFKIKDEDFQDKFETLAHKLVALNLICKLEQTSDGLFIFVQKIPVKKRKFLSSNWIPRILFAVVVGFVMIDGYFRTEAVNNIVDIGDPYEMAGIFTLSLLGILGIHEVGHMVAAKMHKLKIAWPYFIPGLPVVGFIPTFGAVIFQSRGIAINRNILFDVAIAGPIAGLVITIIVAMFASYTAPIFEEDIAQELNLMEWEFGQPLFLKATLTIFGKDVEGQEVLMTPMLFAAWIGFFITFLNLIPAWQLDGGHMARSLLGAKWHRIATYGSIFILFWPLKYFFMAIFLLFMSSRNPGVTPLDDISPITRNRKLLYAVIVILAILCAPLPSTILP